MENYETVTQKLKLGNIFIQQIKYSVLLIILYFQTQQFLQQYSEILLFIAFLNLVFNIIINAYFLFIRKDFPRSEYFLCYFINLVITLIIASYSFFQLFSIQQQYQVYAIKIILFVQIQKVIAYIVIIFYQELQIILIMILPFDISNRQINNGYNTLFIWSMASINYTIELNPIINLIYMINMFNSFFVTLINIIVFNSPKQARLRTVANIFNLILFLLYLLTFLLILQHNYANNNFTFLLINLYKYSIILDLILFSIVVFQEIFIALRLPHQNNTYGPKQLTQSSFYQQFNQSKQLQQSFVTSKKNLLSLRSQQSKGFLKNDSMGTGLKFQKEDSKDDDLEEKKDQVPAEMKGTSKFGALHGMLHSFAKKDQEQMKNDKKVQQEQKSQKGSRKSKKSSVDDSADRSLSINNPMESGSNLNFSAMA